MKILSLNKTAAVISLIAIIACSVSACAQSRYSFQHAYIYTQAIFPGNIRISSTGKPVKPVIDTATIIYLETKGRVTPAWDIAWKNGTVYNITVVAVEGDSVIAGRRKADMQPAVTQAHKGNRIWVVRFIGPVQDTTGTFAQKTNNFNQIVLGAKNSNRRVSLPMSDAIELEPERRP